MCPNAVYFSQWRMIAMIIVLKHGATPDQTEELRCWIRCHDLDVQTIRGEHQNVLVVIGDADRLDGAYIEDMEIVEYVKPVSQPYKLSGKAARSVPSVIDVSGVRVGGGSFAVIAGPCSVESRRQVLGIAQAVKAAGASILRGGAFKPRTSPYTFQGMGESALPMLIEAGQANGMPVVSEITDKEQLPLFRQVDLIQVGARNMQNFELLKELGKLDKPILLKRGWANTVKELLTSAEYIMKSGNDRIILCERGIRTFETATRNTLDLSAVPVIKQLSHLPIIVDPSHATGHAAFVEAMALAAAAAGADGLMLEVHNDPSAAKCDGAQAITPEQFKQTMKKVAAVRSAIF